MAVSASPWFDSDRAMREHGTRQRDPMRLGAIPRAAAAVLAVGLLLMPAAAAPALAPASSEIKQTAAGAELFRTYCAACHGTTARGDGPLADSMTRRPANLTEIGKRNGGVSV